MMINRERGGSGGTLPPSPSSSDVCDATRGRHQGETPNSGRSSTRVIAPNTLHSVILKDNYLPPSLSHIHPPPTTQPTDSPLPPASVLKRQGAVNLLHRSETGKVLETNRK